MNHLTEACVARILSEQLGVDMAVVAPDAKLVDDLGADSLDMVEIVMAIEEEFDITIDDEDATNFVTVRDLLNYVTVNTHV